MEEPLRLKWERFAKLTEARSQFAKTACVYVQTDSQGRPIRIGKASEGLEARYRGGTGYAIDAAMHASGNLVFIAAVDKDLCACVENELIWQGRRYLTYNNQGKITPPCSPVPLSHCGTPPVWNEFEMGEAVTTSKSRFTERDLLRNDLAALVALIQRPELLAPLADTTDLGRQSFQMVLADLVLQVWYHAMAGAILLEQELEPSLHVIERAIFEAAVCIGYLVTHQSRHDEAVVFLAYTHLRDQQEFPDQADLVADRASVLARMPVQAVSEARSRLTTHPFSWSGKTIKKMAQEGELSGYAPLYKFLSGPAHAGVAGRYVKVFDGPNGKRTVRTGTDLTAASAESHANFIRRILHSAFRILVNTLPGPAVQMPTWDPETWSPQAPESADQR